MPLIWSNPEMFPTAKATNALVSNVDLLPTLCELVGVPNWQTKGFKGVDYSQVILDPDNNTSATAVQSCVFFTFDDLWAGQPKNSGNCAGLVPPPNRIQAVRTPDYKYTYYYDGDGVAAPQEEFYDLRPTADGGTDYNDNNAVPPLYNAPGPEEYNNISSDPGSVGLQQAYDDTKALLTAQTGTGGRLAPTDLNAPAAPENVEVKIVNTGSENVVQVSFISLENTYYWLEISTDLTDWDDVDNSFCSEQPKTDPCDPNQPESNSNTLPVKGNNGPVMLCTAMTETKAFYRLRWSQATS